MHKNDFSIPQVSDYVFTVQSHPFKYTVERQFYSFPVLILFFYSDVVMLLVIQGRFSFGSGLTHLIREVFDLVAVKSWPRASLLKRRLRDGQSSLVATLLSLSFRLIAHSHSSTVSSLISFVYHAPSYGG